MPTKGWWWWYKNTSEVKQIKINVLTQMTETTAQVIRSLSTIFHHPRVICAEDTQFSATHLWCNKEVLRSTLFACSFHHHIEDSPFINWVHSLKKKICINISSPTTERSWNKPMGKQTYLIYFIYYSERAFVKFLQSHQIQHSWNTSFPSTLVVWS